MDKQANNHLERFSPLLLYTILSAVRRFEPDFYAHLCRSYHLDADRILGLFSEVEEIGAGQIQAILRDLRAHQAYHDMVYLAGRNAFLYWTEQNRIRKPIIGSQSARFIALMKQLMPEFLGSASYTAMLRGSVHFIEIRDSLFARDDQFDRPLCGFYSGCLAEAAKLCGAGTAVATEVRCCANDPNAPTCLFQVGFQP
jgi:hypothetical protein